MQITQFLGKISSETNSGISQNLWQFLERLFPLLFEFRTEASEFIYSWVKWEKNINTEKLSVQL